MLLFNPIKEARLTNNLYFNTSNVTIQLNQSCQTLPLDSISIHLMLLFNELKDNPVVRREVFQYI